MIEPILHTRTEAALKNYLSKPSHALILSGETGIGKLYVALWLANEMNINNFILSAETNKAGISIEQIRELYNTTRTGLSLCVILEDAHTLSQEAQNAFLKLLEEPPKNTRFIITTKSVQSLLPTIRSRSQTIEILSPTTKQFLEFAVADSSKSERELNSLIVTTKQRPGTFMQALADSSRLESHQAHVAEAKQFYASSAYERQILCIEKKFEKEWAASLLELLATIVESLIKTSLRNPAQLTALRRQAALIEATSEHVLAINGNPKIHLAKLAEEL